MSQDLRDLIGKLTIPAPGQELTLTPEIAKQITAVCPFWTTLLKKQTINDMADGDAFVSGFAEMFSRIFRALPDPTNNVLGRLTVEDVYVVDEAIQNGGAEELTEVYPNAKRAPDLGPFGGGVLLAYGMFERALTGELPKPVKKEEESPEQAPKDVVSELEKGLDEETLADPGPAKEAHFNAPISLLLVDAKDRWVIEGEITYMSQAAQIHGFCMQVFNADPTIKSGAGGRIHFELSILKRS